MTQEEWDRTFQISKRTFQSAMDALIGRRLCPAHAGKLLELVKALEIPDFPKNPGRKDAAKS